MTRANVLASVLYHLACSLKTMRFSDLGRKKQRDEVLRVLSSMQLLVHAIGMKHISEVQAEHIIATLGDACNDCACLEKASPDSEHIEQHEALLFEMQQLLTECTAALCCRTKHYREVVRAYILRFHNLPRAFLSSDDEASLLPKEAWEYATFYAGLDV